MRKSLQLFVTISLLLMATCSSRPEGELLEARQAVETARTVDADLYCPEIYQRAADFLSAGELEVAVQEQTRMTRRTYEKAIDLLTSARWEAEAAAATAAARRETATSIANCRQGRAEMDLEQARKRVASSSADQQDELVRDFQVARRLIGEARKAYSEGRFMDAAHQFEAATLQSRAILSHAHTRR